MEWLPNPPLTTLKQPGNILSRFGVIIGRLLEYDLTLHIPIVIPSVNERKSLDGRLWSSRAKPQLCQVPTSFPRGPRSTYNWKIRSRSPASTISGLQSRKCAETSQRDVGRDVVSIPLIWWMELLESNSARTSRARSFYIISDQLTTGKLCRNHLQ